MRSTELSYISASWGGGELGRHQHLIARHRGHEAAQNALRLAHGVDGGGVPQAQAFVHSGLKDGTQRLLAGLDAIDGIAAKSSRTPGPGANCNLRFFHIVSILHGYYSL